MHPTSALNRVEVLRTSQVENLLAMKETQKALRDRLAIMDQAIEKQESEIVGMLERGCDASRCGYLIAIDEVSRRYPKWKEEFISRMGKPAADAVLAATPATVSKRLVVKGGGVL